MAFTTPGTAVAGSVLTSAFWNTNVRDNTNALYQSAQRIGYQTRTTDATISATSFAAAPEYFNSDITWTADGTSAYRIVMFLNEASAGTGGLLAYCLSNGSTTEITRLGLSAPSPTVIYSEFFYTPSAGSTSVNVRIFRINSNGTVFGSATKVNFMAVYGPDIT
jgi:hypothetical protein